MKKILILLIAVVYTLVLTIRPLGSFALAGYGSDIGSAYEAETDTQVEETESETELPYSPDDFYELSHVIQAEAGYCERAMMTGVGSVVLNRVASDKFPNTIYDVIHQPGQYTCIDNGTFYNEPTWDVLDVTDFLLRVGSQYPPDVLYQANSPQGTGTYKTLSTSYSTMYFCYG